MILSSINRDYINTITEENREPTWLSEMRGEAFSKYTALPTEVSPLYSKYSDANRLLQKVSGYLTKSLDINLTRSFVIV